MEKKEIKRKYTLKELKELKDNDKLEDMEFGCGIKIGVIGYGLSFGYGVYDNGSLVYVDKPFRLTLGLLRELNRLLKDKRKEK